MAAPRNNTYAVASGAGVYAGREAPSGLPSWVSSQPLWTWFDVPNSALSSVAPSPWPLGKNPSNKVTAWCGATLKRSGSVYMLGAAGGHGDYHGNEVNALALNTETPGWVELRGPTPDAQIYKSTPVYADLRRSSTHTYWATQFDNTNNRMLIVSTGGPHGVAPPSDPPGGWAWPQNDLVLMGFDLGTNDWTHPDALARLPAAYGTADLCCTHPGTGEIFAVKIANGNMHKYVPSTNSWSTVGAFYLNGGYSGAAIDPVRNRMLVVGDFGGTTDPYVRSTTTAASVSATFGGLGASALRMSGYPGVVFDEANDTFLVFSNTSPISVYRVTAGTWSVDQPSITGTVAQRQNGIHNSVQYVPELKGVVICNAYASNVRFMRTAE